MRLDDLLSHPKLHSALTNVSPDQHHSAPSRIAIVNTSLAVPPLPGGPALWDIVVPYDTKVVSVSLRSAHAVALAGAMAGAMVLATRDQTEASGWSHGGSGSLTSGAYSAVYTKAASALNLTDKTFDNTGASISLTDAHLVETVVGTTRVLRLAWTNYAASTKTLDARGEITCFS
jgi:hypothetical protein